VRHLLKISLFFLSLFLFAASAQAQEDIPFDILTTESCLVDKEQYARHDCIGASANICMETQLGGTTVGMGFCINQELDWWDARLNDTYRKLLAREKADDEENIKDGINRPLLKADALKDMQRTWIKYRDAFCEHEAVQWGAGTGAGPAFLGCLLGETGRQVFVLEDRLSWGG